MQIDIDHCDADDPSELYRRYPIEAQAQPVEIQFDIEYGQLGARYNPEIGDAKPRRAHHGIVRTWDVPATPTSSSMNTLLDELAGPAAELWAQSEVVWDGSNHVGRLTDKASDIEEQIQRTIDDWCADLNNAQVESIDCHDWMNAESLESILDADGVEITADTTDDELDKAFERLHECAHTETTGGVVVIDGLDDLLEMHRDQLREGLREHLETISERLDSLTDERNDLIRRIYAWNAGDTDRSLERLAGVSRATIARIRGAE